MNKGKGFQEKIACRSLSIQLARRIAKHEKQLQKLTSYYQDYINKHKQSIKQSPNSTDCCISENNDKTGNISKHNPVTCPDDMIASQDTALFLPTLQMFDNDDDDNQALTQIEDHDGHIENDSQLTGHDIDLVSNLQGNGMETVEDDSLLMLEAKATPSYKCDNNASINSDNSHALSTGNKRQQSVDTKIKSLNWTINSCADVDDIEKSSTTLYEFQLQACLQVKEPVKSIAFSSNNGNCNDSIKIATCSDRIITIWTLSKDDFSEWNFVKCLTCDKNMEKFSDVNFLSTDTGICISVTGKFRASHNRIYRITDKEDFSLELRSGCSKFPCKCEYRSVNCPPGHKNVITAILNGNDKNYYFRKYCLDDKCQNLISCNDFEKPNILEKLSSIVVAHGSELMLLGLFEKTIVLWNWSNYQITKRIALDGSFIEKEAAKCFRVVIEKDWLFAVIGSSFDKLTLTAISFRLIEEQGINIGP
ncbi:uncharacterized protein TRIADDRAFT_53646 [Trichoplax adhaerens]|uniref:Partner and localiser of BRCA2 WD40 domain-containing protein n=1 Tax=Trichoplax adhaerens TaxID=10228 RepID=B3RPS5_TRIAD|nr:predicted protein [Trichoplax adhaerens]EDV27691.1 predicted protein [Trichoplax adhaerens]|eukprot:XP_002109525.1 predicted protein [Trichoplax adhaerens]